MGALQREREGALQRMVDPADILGRSTAGATLRRQELGSLADHALK